VRWELSVEAVQDFGMVYSTLKVVDGVEEGESKLEGG
jgi:hypothetical protein